MDDFVEFATAAVPRLRRTAFLLCGDWHLAEDLAQATLTKMFVSWRRIRRQDAVCSYASRTLVNTYSASRRARRAGEVVTDVVPERIALPESPETRMVVLAALATLAPRARAVVVLRYWADMSVEEVASVLGCSEGPVSMLSGTDKSFTHPLALTYPAGANPLSLPRQRVDLEPLRPVRSAANQAWS
jgi:RNA polymerase sigma-70 factor (sigma-E family)